MIIPLHGTETEFGEAGPECDPGNEFAVDQEFSNPGEQTEQPIPADPTHLEGSRLLDISHEALEDVTERIDWNLEFVEAPDSDGDGPSDFLEAVKFHTDPGSADTDGDGYSDGAEVAAGTDPLDPNSHPSLLGAGGGNGGGGGAGDAGGGAGAGAGGNAEGGPGSSTCDFFQVYDAHDFPGSWPPFQSRCGSHPCEAAMAHGIPHLAIDIGTGRSADPPPVSTAESAAISAGLKDCTE